MKNESKKTIAFYIGSLSRGGAEHVMVNLAAYFQSEGYRVYFVTKLIDEPEYEVPEGVTRIVADITAQEETASRISNLKKRINKLKNIFWVLLGIEINSTNWFKIRKNTYFFKT